MGINFIRRIIKSSVQLAVLLTVLVTFTGCSAIHNGVLNPKGTISYIERALLFDSIALMLIVVLPVIIMSFAFVYRYREAHRTSEYKPNWSHSFFLEALWWGVPCAIILVLGIMTWHMTHKLDPYRPITATGKPLEIKAVALPWKWLFIYPQQNIATVNFLELPKNREVKFKLTSDNVPMSAFFVPQLGSQIYTMAGMQTKLHLIANHKGVYEGLDSQYNGPGFSDMHFKVKVVDQNQLDQWANSIKQNSQKLNGQAYQSLRKPSIAHPVEYYSAVKPGLFKQIIQSYNAREHP